MYSRKGRFPVQNTQRFDFKQRSESFFVGALLSFAGGFLDAYTYITRGGVFANAQTGNMVLLGLRLSEQRWADSLSYLIPILAFAAGVLLAEWIRSAFRKTRRLHWRQLVLGIECVLLLTIGFVPSGRWNPSVNIAISFVCALQAESFRTVHGLAYATTMCTGNLRSGTELLFRSIQGKDIGLLRSAMKYYAIIAVFICGAVGGFLAATAFGIRSVWIAFLILLFVFILLWQHPPEIRRLSQDTESEAHL